MSENRKSVSWNHPWSFTLIELLIVIAIIAILAGMLLPALNAAKEKARAVQCTGNLRNIALQVENYESSYGDYYIPCCRGTSSVSGESSRARRYSGTHIGRGILCPGIGIALDILFNLSACQIEFSGLIRFLDDCGTRILIRSGLHGIGSHSGTVFRLCVDLRDRLIQHGLEMLLLIRMLLRYRLCLRNGLIVVGGLPPLKRCHANRESIVSYLEFIESILTSTGYPTDSFR